MRIGQADGAKLDGGSGSQQVSPLLCDASLLAAHRHLSRYSGAALSHVHQWPPLKCAAASQVVSVMLPSVRSQDGHSTNLTSLDHIYVVLLQPGESYTTYACSLDHLVFA